MFNKILVSIHQRNFLLVNKHSGPPTPKIPYPKTYHSSHLFYNHHQTTRRIDIIEKVFFLPFDETSMSLMLHVSLTKTEIKSFYSLNKYFSIFFHWMVLLSFQLMNLPDLLIPPIHHHHFAN